MILPERAGQLLDLKMHLCPRFCFSSYPSPPNHPEAFDECSFPLSLLFDLCVPPSTCQAFIHSATWEADIEIEG